MGRSQRTKGAAGEREVCAVIRDVLGIDARRNLAQAREGGADIALEPYQIEVKRRRRIANAYEWIAQASAACRPGERPLVAFRADGRGWLACLPLEHLLMLIREEVSCRTTG